MKLIDILEAAGLIEYGATIDGDILRSIADIDVPDIGTRADFKQAELAEFKVYQSLKDQLLDRGMHLHQVGDAYRIALPSEHESIADRYRAAARRKDARALKLLRNTPATPRHILVSADALHLMRGLAR